MDVLETIKQFVSTIDVIDVACVAGLVLFGVWLLKTSFGRKALADSAPRRNNMPIYLPFIPALIWFGPVPFAVLIAREVSADLPDWQIAFLDNLIICVGSVATMVVIILLVRVSFARRLKGFGLNAKTIIKDFFVGAVNLLSVWPLVMLMIVLTLYFGGLISEDFEIQQHEELEQISGYPQLPLRILIVVVTVVIAPVFEEMLFRGLFQTMIRSFVGRPWLAVVISSILFSLAHYTPTHWPALFVLAMCLGYAYEKSGSLLRPIFIHAFFNGIAIMSVLRGAD